MLSGRHLSGCAWAPGSNLWSGCPFPSLSPKCPCSALLPPPTTFSDKSGGVILLEDGKDCETEQKRFVIWPLF